MHQTFYLFLQQIILTDKELELLIDVKDFPQGTLDNILQILSIARILNMNHQLLARIDFLMIYQLQLMQIS